MPVYAWLIVLIAIGIGLIACFSEIKRARDRRSSKLHTEARDQFLDTCEAAVESARAAIDRCKGVAAGMPPGSAFAFLGDQLTRLNAEVATAAASIEGLRRAVPAHAELGAALSNVVSALRDLQWQPMQHSTLAGVAGILQQATDSLDENLEVVRALRAAFQLARHEALVPLIRPFG
jgi:hypothetical protein